MTLRGRLLFIPLLVGLLTATGAWAQGPEAEAARAAAKQAASKADTEEALALLKGMLHYLAGLSRFAFVAHTAYDAVQETGQKLEFGGRRRLLVRRPDRMRVEVAGRVQFDRETRTLTVELEGKLPRWETLAGLERDYRGETRDATTVAGPFCDLGKTEVFDL